MILTQEQQALLNGEKGETMAKVVKTLVMYGDAFGAERMVPVTSKCGHTVISFGLKAITPVYELEKEFFPQAEWFVDAYHQKICPLPGHTPVYTFTTEEDMRRGRLGV